jgi:hypothetical protein
MNERRGGSNMDVAQMWRGGAPQGRTQMAEMKRSNWSGRRDLNPGPLAPQASALARLRHGPNYQTILV